MKNLIYSLREWRRRRWLKRLGPIALEHVAAAEKRAVRWQNDALTGRVFTVERGASFVTAGKQMQQVRGGLWHRERRLR